MSVANHADDDVILALALAAGASCVAAAGKANVSERTARRKLADPAFRTLVAELRAEFVSQALGRMAASMTRAADVLVALLDLPDPTIRLRAARSIMSLCLRLLDVVDVADRIHGLEIELARKQGVLLP